MIRLPGVTDYNCSITRLVATELQLKSKQCKFLTLNQSLQNVLLYVGRCVEGERKVEREKNSTLY